MKKLSISKQMNGNAVPKITAAVTFSAYLHPSNCIARIEQPSEVNPQAEKPPLGGRKICGIHPNE